MSKIIICGNSKGGTGKSTIAMHIATALALSGIKTGALDTDLRQASFASYVMNRFAREDELPAPALKSLGRDASEEDLIQAIAELEEECETIVIDTPGADTRLSRLAHSYADIIVTPLNDSFIDFDVLGEINPMNMKIAKPGPYSALVFEAWQKRAQQGKSRIDWVVLRNRLSNLESRNKKEMEKMLEALKARVGFRLAPGLSERVIYRELFLQGLTLLDLKQKGMSMAHVTARQELRTLIQAIGLSEVNF